MTGRVAETHAFVATCGRGLEGALARELTALGAEAVEERVAAVGFRGSIDAGYRAVLWSRVASRVLLPLAEGSVVQADDLYELAKAVRWEDHLPAGKTFAVDAAGRHPAFRDTRFAALRVKDALVDRLRDRRGERPNVDPAAPDVALRVRLEQTRAFISLDLAGEGLHLRGYRTEAGEAPLRETVAAGLLVLADWPRLVTEGLPLLDPFCGSGTLLIEAAWMAADRAPGLDRRRWGFTGWSGHEPHRWEALVSEARERAARGTIGAGLLFGSDTDVSVLNIAYANARRAGVLDRITLEHVALADRQAPLPQNALCVLRKQQPHRPENGASDGPVSPAGDPCGLVVTNPPYGERLGAGDDLPALYASLGDTLKRRFPGWRAHVLVGDRELEKKVGLRPRSRTLIFNGALECRLLEIPISAAPVAAGAPSWRHRGPSEEELSAFTNRLAKVWKERKKWAAREGTTAFRVYDADLPDFSLAIDRYADAVHVQEYAAPATVDPEKAALRLAAALEVVPGVLDVRKDAVFLKVRRRQKGHSQYERQSDDRARRIVTEDGLKFEVNLSDYLDTGLFLDHRLLRRRLRAEAAGKQFLNLFSYTGAATVHAASGDAASTLSIDLSNTYLDWAERNLRLNNVPRGRHELLRADCLKWLAEETRRWDLILLAPPTFSTSKSMDETLDVQRDHVELLRATLRRLAPKGTLYFSINQRRFKLDEAALPGLEIVDVTAETQPHDFARNPRIHRTWRFRRT
jgi:23S rRNA (guanine2445-N2)-methyltransferase / 23S rRNA (guanine2069-N7)-methyltransferase